MKLSKANVPFTMVANEVLSREDLSLRAKGLYAYLFSKPDGWDFAAPRIADECKESKDIVFRVLKELENANLLSRRRLSSGRMEYHLSYASEPEVEMSQPLFNLEEKAKKNFVETFGKTVQECSDKELMDIVSGSIPSPTDGLNDLIEEFKPVNPSYARLFSNKTQRGALTRVVQSIGFDKTRNAIRAAVAVHGSAYAPTITTCVQLEERLGSLSAYVKKTRRGPAVVAI